MPRPHMLARARPALGDEVLAGALVPAPDGLDVAAPAPDPVELAEEVEEADPEGAPDPEGAVPAPVPGRTW